MIGTQNWSYPQAAIRMGDQCSFRTFRGSCRGQQPKCKCLVQFAQTESASVSMSAFPLPQRISPRSSTDSMRTNSSIQNAARMQLLLLPRNKQEAWEDLEDALFIVLKGRSDHVNHFRTLYNAGLTRFDLILSVAYLASHPNPKQDANCFHEHILAVASYLSLGRVQRELKFALLKAMLSCLSPLEAMWQVEDSVLNGTLDFLTERENSEWEYMEHSEMVLLWELRAMCLRLVDEKEERLARVAKTGDTAAVVISVGAKLVEEGMARSIPVISNHIEVAGGHVKEMVKPNDYPLMVDRDAVVVMAFSDAAKRASEGAKDGTKVAVNRISEASQRSFFAMTNNLDEAKLEETLSPEGVEAIKAVGKVCIATVGAAATVGEAFVESTRELVRTTAGVTADVVEHKYGTTAGRVVTDAGETAGNVLRTLGNVALVSKGKVMAKSVAKSASKEQVEEEFERAKEMARLLERHATAWAGGNVDRLLTVGGITNGLGQRPRLHYG